MVLAEQPGLRRSRGVQLVLGVEQLQRGDGRQRGPAVQQAVDVGHAGPVPAGDAGQHLGQAAGMVPATVQAMVPQQLVVGSLQPGGASEGETV